MTTPFLILIALMVLGLLVLMRIQYVRGEDHYYAGQEDHKTWERINRRYDAAIWFVWLFCMISIAVLIYLKVS